MALGRQELTRRIAGWHLPTKEQMKDLKVGDKILAAFFGIERGAEEPTENEYAYKVTRRWDNKIEIALEDESQSATGMTEFILQVDDVPEFPSKNKPKDGWLYWKRA